MVKNYDNVEILKKLHVRQPGIEPGSIAWKATMLTFTPPTPWYIVAKWRNIA